MLDIELLRKTPDLARRGIAEKNLDPKIVEEFLALDEKWRGLRREVDDLLQEQKRLSSERKLDEAKQNKERIKIKESQLADTEGERRSLLLSMPNIPSPDAPRGKGEEGNVVLREVGEKPNFSFPVRDYLALAEKLDLVDIEKAAQVSGSRFGYLKNDAVMLEFALVKLALELARKEGFAPVIPPVMIRPEVYEGMGRLAGDQKEERYFLPSDNLYLTGSAEHTLGPLHLNDILEEAALPRRYVGFSTNFRREAGSYGKDTRGILRVHQFDKVELYSFTTPERSSEEHLSLLAFQEKFMQTLGLPYRVVEICTGDMGWTDARQYDIETWLPGEGKYRETHSCSNTTDFQTRGINARYRGKDGSPLFLHALNATACAIGRTLIAIFENYQNADGTIAVPKALEDYVGKKVIA